MKVTLPLPPHVLFQKQDTRHIELDFANADVRQFILQLWISLQHFEANGGTGGQPEVKVGPYVDKILQEMMKPPKK